MNSLSQIEAYTNSAKAQFLVLITNDYTEAAIDNLERVTTTIPKLFNTFKYELFSEIIIYSPLSGTNTLQNFTNNYTPCSNFQNISQIEGQTLTIEVLNTGAINYSIDFVPELSQLRNNSVVFVRNNEGEAILGKSEYRKLVPLPGYDSYFAIQTYKTLEEAFENYRTKIARLSSFCEFLPTVWLNENKIFLSPRPEKQMRKSLERYLNIALLGAVEIRDEQTVDGSHPVDIKVTWSYTNKQALIEIKWMGKSTRALGSNFTFEPDENTANAGAEQLAKYLDDNKVDAPTYTATGYLVVFDARRNNVNVNTDSLNRADALYYQALDVNYVPDYSMRNDFARPVRFFMEPKYTL